MDRSLHSRINLLVRECCANPFTGLGKPEPLRYAMQGYWSRRINDEHRLVYQVSDESIHILHCRGHCQKKK